jgi:Kef-type K+ transport system membrane component KefB
VEAQAGQIALEMLIVFGSAKLLAEVSGKLKQPPLVGEILAGVLIGPGVLGWIHPGSFLSALSTLGVLFLLFRVGLEVKTAELLSVGGAAVLVAVLGVAAPFGAGWLIMAAWGASRVEAIFVGAAMVATSVGITAQVLASKGLLNHRASRIILAAAIIDDILGLLVLALVNSVATDSVNLLGLFVTGMLAIGFTLVIAKWGTRALEAILPHVEARLETGEAQFNLSMILLFALSALAVYAGVAAIIGAFLAGMALADTVGHRVRDLSRGVTELLAPFFLVGIGLNFDLNIFRSWPTVLLAFTILAAAVVSKLVGCGLGAARLGWRDMLRVGCGMVPRGEVGMVVAQLGLSMGVIQKPVYGVVVFMAVATTVIAPPFLALSFRGMKPETPVQTFS